MKFILVIAVLTSTGLQSVDTSKKFDRLVVCENFAYNVNYQTKSYNVIHAYCKTEE